MINAPCSPWRGRQVGSRKTQVGREGSRPPRPALEPVDATPSPIRPAPMGVLSHPELGRRLRPCPSSFAAGRDCAEEEPHHSKTSFTHGEILPPGQTGNLQWIGRHFLGAGICQTIKVTSASALGRRTNRNAVTALVPQICRTHASSSASASIPRDDSHLAMPIRRWCLLLGNRIEPLSGDCAVASSRRRSSYGRSRLDVVSGVSDIQGHSLWDWPAPSSAAGPPSKDLGMPEQL